MGNGQGHGEKEARLSIEKVPDYGAKSPSKSESFPCGNYGPYRTAYLWLRSTQARLTFIILIRSPMDASYIIFLLTEFREAEGLVVMTTKMIWGPHHIIPI